MRISTCVGPILRTPCAQKLTRLFVDSLSTTNRKSFIGPDQLAPVVRMYPIMSRSHIKFVVLTMHSKPPNQCRNDLSTDQSLNSMHFEIGLEPSSGVRPQRLDRIDGLWRLPDGPEKFVANNKSFSKSIAVSRWWCCLTWPAALLCLRLR